MRVYETTFILSPQADDASFDRQIKSVNDLITRNKGKVIKEDRWGIRRLAYPIKKFTQGYFAHVIFKGNSDVLREMDRFFRLEEPFIRNLTVQFDGIIDEAKDDEKTEEKKVQTDKPKVPKDKPIEKTSSEKKLDITETNEETAGEVKPTAEDSSTTAPADIDRENVEPREL